MNNTTNEIPVNMIDITVRDCIDKLSHLHDEISKHIPIESHIEKNADGDEFTYVNLRISTAMLNEVDATWKKRVGIKKTGWILEAIQEKLNNTRK